MQLGEWEGCKILRIDAHQHFWKYCTLDYPWIGPTMDTLQRDRLPDDLVPLLRHAGIDGTIAVQVR